MKIKRGVVLAVAGSLAVGYFWGVLSLRLMVFPYPQIRSVLAATGLYRPIAAGGGYAKSPVKRPSRGCGPCILLRAVVFLWVSAEACVGVLPNVLPLPGNIRIRIMERASNIPRLLNI